ncbi:MAG: hypothetical protein OXD43_03635 [Bacteroidetes bacterium]|nr:hypothetical protein [Bacteroidota bacterium]
MAENHRITDDVYEGYVRLLDPDMRGSIMELAIACGLVEVRPDGYARPMSRAQQNAFGHALHICGWHKVRQRVERVRQRVWFLPKS